LATLNIIRWRHAAIHPKREATACAIATVGVVARILTLILTKVCIVVRVFTGFQVLASLILASREWIRILEINAVPARVGQHTPCETTIGPVDSGSGGHDLVEEKGIFEMPAVFAISPASR